MKNLELLKVASSVDRNIPHMVLMWLCYNTYKYVTIYIGILLDFFNGKEYCILFMCQIENV